VQVSDKEQKIRSLIEADKQELKEHFHELVAVAERITDFETVVEGDGADAGNKYGVAIDFDEDDDEAGPGSPLNCTMHSWIRGWALLGLRTAAVTQLCGLRRFHSSALCTPNTAVK
jgi:hypothetical protein